MPKQGNQTCNCFHCHCGSFTLCARAVPMGNVNVINCELMKDYLNPITHYTSVIINVITCSFLRNKGETY